MKKIFLLVLLSFLIVAPTHAQEASMTITPSFYHLTTTPASIHTFRFSFENNADPQLYTFRLYQLGNPDLHGIVKPLPEITAPISIELTAPQIKFGERVLLRTNEREEIPVEIVIPEETPEGEYVFAIAIEALSTTPDQGTATIAIENGIGLLLPITVTKTNKDSKKVSMSLQRAAKGVTIPWGRSTLHFIDTKTPVPLTLLVKNSGKFHVIPKGEIQLKNQNNTAQRFGIVPGYVYPYSQRILSTAGYSKESCLSRFSQSLCDNDFSVVLDPLEPGFYQVTARMQFGKPDPIIYSNDYFIVLPFFLTAGIILSLFSAVFFVIVAWIGYYKNPSHHHRY